MKARGLGVADHLRVRASHAYRLRDVEDLPASRFIIRYRPIRGDDDDPVVEVGEQRLQAHFPASSCRNRTGKVGRHPVHRVRHLFELVPRPDLGSSGRGCRRPSPSPPTAFRQWARDPPRHEGGARQDQEESEEPGPPDDPVICQRRRVREATGTEARAAPTIDPPHRDR